VGITEVLGVTIGIIVALLGAITRVVWDKVSKLETTLPTKATVVDVSKNKSDLLGKASTEAVAAILSDVAEVKQNVAVLVERTSTVKTDSDLMKATLARVQEWLALQQSKKDR
jgi:hypothetical protein